MKNFVALLLLSLPIVSWAGPKVALDWTYEHQGTEKHYHRDFGPDSNNSYLNYHQVTDKGSIKFLNAQIIRDKLIFELIAHNPGTSEADWYQCMYIGSSKDQVHMDDDMANEYKGLKLIFSNNQDNKLALNQRKKFKLEMQAPKNEASRINLHFGFRFSNHPSSKNCFDAVQNHGQNFHKYNWDITPLKAQANAQL